MSNSLGATYKTTKESNLKELLSTTTDFSGHDLKI